MHELFSTNNSFLPLTRLQRLHRIRFMFPGANTDGLPAGVLYQVKASYRYQAEDVDELNFDVGEVINVVEYDDPDDQVGAAKMHKPSKNLHFLH